MLKMSAIDEFIAKAPKNVKLIIINFYYRFYHNSTFYNTLQQIPVKGTIMRMNNYTKLPESSDSPYLAWQNRINMITYLPDVADILFKLQNCNCCKRHQIRKPETYWKFINQANLDNIKIMNENYDYEDEEDEEYEEYLECHCICRQMKRFIYRYHPHSINY